MQKLVPALTVRQRCWLEHVQACEASGQSMAEYAASKNVAVRAMYAGRKTLMQKGVLPTKQSARFQRVQAVAAPVSNQWRMSLYGRISSTNNAALSAMWRAPQPGQKPHLLQLKATLPTETTRI